MKQLIKDTKKELKKYKLFIKGRRGEIIKVLFLPSSFLNKKIERGLKWIILE